MKIREKKNEMVCYWGASIGYWIASSVRHTYIALEFSRKIKQMLYCSDTCMRDVWEKF